MSTLDNKPPLMDVIDLSAKINNREILKAFNLRVLPGEIHAIMGPNGSGKSTFAKVLAGHPSYEITSGSIRFKGKDISKLLPEDRSREGIFMGFQYPVEIPGVTNSSFLRLAFNTLQTAKGNEEMDPIEFNDYLQDKIKLLEISPDFLDRSVNGGFSGGEKKRNEILQMAVLKPKLSILDETDSGLDIDALRIVAQGVNNLSREDNGIILITHYQRLLNYIKPDFVHIMDKGNIIKTGDRNLAIELEEEGYDNIISSKGTG